MAKTRARASQWTWRREVCERTGKAVVIDGSIAALGSQYVLGLGPINCHTGEILVTEQHSGRKEHVLDAMPERRKAPPQAWRVTGFSGEIRCPPENVTTPSLGALQAYSWVFEVHVRQAR